MKKKTFCIKTLGCKVNQYESQLIREGFLKRGYDETDSIEKADICVINTCTVTSTSDSKSMRLIRHAAKRPDNCVVATGCMAEDKDLDLSKFKGADFIVRNKDKHRISEIVEDKLVSGPDESKRGIRGISGFKGHTRVFVKIQDGCNNACSYCKVRVVRGKSASRPFAEILDECNMLISNGTKEIILSGICLGAYGRDLKGSKMTLSGLISELCRIAGDWRLRLSSIEPKDIGKDLIEQFHREDRLCKHLHIPFQSGDDYILKRMKRPYSRKDYLAIVARIRDVVPDFAISTDIMVGFPGETEKRFLNTMNFIRSARPMRMHIFPFSKREGTLAYGYKPDIPDSLKKERRDRLLKLSEELSLDFLNGFLNKDTKVLVEEKKNQDGYLQGYTDRYIKVYITGPDSIKDQFVICRPTLTNRKVCGILSSYYFNSSF